MNPVELCTLDIQNRKRRLRTWMSELNFGPRDVLSYYSTWSMIFCLLPFQNRMLDLIKLNMLLQCSLGGFYFSYIFPCEIKIHYLKLILNGNLLKVMDFCAHQLIFFMYLFKNGMVYPENFIDFFLMNIPMMVYMIFFDIHEKYGIDYEHVKNMIPFYFLFFLFNNI